MTDKEMSDAELISKYRTESIARRARGKTTATVAEAPLAVKAENGVFTVRFAPDAKPMSELGGVAKVLGLSQIDIPEFKIRGR